MIRGDLDPAGLARAYAAGGAAALSVLTETRFFLGSADDLRRARAACALPVLRKDFLFCDYQLYESAAMGADAVLLIVRILTEPLLADLLRTAAALGLAALVEVYSAAEAETAARAGARLVGINNRDLSSFPHRPRPHPEGAARARPRPDGRRGQRHPRPRGHPALPGDAGLQLPGR